METVDVVVVGAGPAGCMVAGELALAGRSVVVLEKHAAPSPLSRAFGVHARTLEVLDCRGLADELLDTGTTAPGLALWGRGELDLSGLPSRYPYLLVTPQYQTERLLEARALDHGADIVRDVYRATSWRDRLGFVLRGPGWAYRRRAELGAAAVSS